MRTGLYQTISQKLVMTPKLQQAINLLQMPNLELLFCIRQEILLNPVLEEITKEENIEDNQFEPDVFDDSFEEIFKEKEDLKFKELDELFQERDSLYYEKDEGSFFEKPVAVQPSLAQHLIWQLHLTKLEANEIKLGEIIISEIDEKGYLKTPLEELSGITNIPLPEINKVLKIIQTFDPIGVGARDLKECLLLQLGKKLDIEKLATKIVENYLEEVKEKAYNKVAKELDVEPEKVKDAFDLIHNLNPSPGSSFEASEFNHYIIPDIIVDKVENEYVVIINDDGLPKLRFNNYYLKLMRCKDRLSKDVREFLEKKFQSASWFLGCIEQRRMTLYRVTSAIVEKQQVFLEDGPKYLNPLNLKQIAEVVGLHESTVSRAVNNKYVQTPLGIFELKFFFSKSIALKETIRDIIEKEENVLSDERIAILLKDKGINIARRTVTKYRDELKIPGLNKRKADKT